MKHPFLNLRLSLSIFITALFLFCITGCSGYIYSKGPLGGAPTTIDASPVSVTVSLLPAQISWPGTVDLDYLTNQLYDGLKGTHIFNNFGIEMPDARYTITPTVFLLTDITQNVVHLELIVQHASTQKSIYYEALVGGGFTQSQSIGNLKNFMAAIGPEIAHAISSFEEQAQSMTAPAEGGYSNIDAERRKLRPPMRPVQYCMPLTIAVANITSDAQLQDEANDLTERIHSALIQADCLSVLLRPDMEEVLTTQTFQYTDVCDTTSCLSEMGKILSVQIIVGGKLERVGESSSVSLSFVNVETGKTKFTVDHGWKGEPVALLKRVRDSITHLAAEYTQQQSKQISSEPVLLDFLKDGATTKKEVFQSLGFPPGEYDGGHIIIYRVRKRDESYVLVNKVTGWAGIDYNLILVFDDANVLKKHSLVGVR